MKTTQIVKELEGAVEQLGLRVRRETGNFRGGPCVRNEEALLMLNRRHPPEIHLAVLADALQDLPVDTIFLRPAVRRALEDAWARHDVVEIETEE
ncbi:MAG: hypothetical protein COV99_02790 [Bacteroidetes bacterium CG12_big_fil_rev_8_21_14_0_65_60_17]|nr:MAG: hypothetical protein COV99_02790 [Bacteroidetes bacterium CG12_big_fil_rev_8_21_14_0_65_60_17]